MRDIVLLFFARLHTFLFAANTKTAMLLVFIKSVVTFVLIFFVVRLMGKRQIGEMQPFELVITLIIAEVACIPMNDPYIPFYYGVVPIVTLSFLQILFSFLSEKFLPVRRLISGKSVTLINKDGVCYENLKKLNMNMSDLMEAVRSAGYPDLDEIMYAIIETNGKICVVEKAQSGETFLPVSVILNGKWQEENVAFTGLDKNALIRQLDEKGNKVCDLVYADVRQNGSVYCAPEKGACYTLSVTLSGGGSW